MCVMTARADVGREPDGSASNDASHTHTCTRTRTDHFCERFTGHVPTTPDTSHDSTRRSRRSEGRAHHREFVIVCAAQAFTMRLTECKLKAARRRNHAISEAEAGGNRVGELLEGGGLLGKPGRGAWLELGSGAGARQGLGYRPRVS